VKIGILGGGFGIYGYLPAACSLNWSVVTLSRYRDSIMSRPELSDFQNSVEYVDTEEELLSSCTSVAIARTPDLQYQFLKKYPLELRGIEHLFLEKPLTSSMENSLDILDFLRNSKLSFSLGYLFLHTDWFDTISQVLQSKGNTIKINWSIPSPKSFWKGSRNLGGGIDSFFLIHFVPIFLKLGFQMSNLKVSHLGEMSFLRVSDMNTIEIFAEVKDCDFGFEVLLNNLAVPIYEAETPFGPKPKLGVVDPRITALQKYLISSIEDTDGSANALKVENGVIEFLTLCKS
jgi:hypothetical protein